MNKYLLILCSVLFSFSVSGQTNSKYLAGAVPEVDGKVKFEKTITVQNGLADKDLYSLMDKWAKQNYPESAELKNRVLLSSPDNKNIACQGETYLVFQRGALVLDRAKMLYQLIIQIENGKCDVTVRNIKYDYADEKDLIPAESQITDAVALNKNKDKLNRYYDKFRTHTIDSVNSIFDRIDIYLNGISKQGAAASQPQMSQAAPAPVRTEPLVEAKTVVAAPVSVETTPAPVAIVQKEEPVAPAPVQVVQDVMPPQVMPAPLVVEQKAAGMEGYRQIAPDKIPGNIVKLLNDATLITSGTAEQTNVMTASWGGLGRFWEKPVTFCFLNPTRYSVQTMDKGDTYTISFYTEAYRDAVMYCGSVSGRNTDKIKGSGLTPIKTPSGATAFAEAWMIFECKKIVAQPISPDAVVDKNMPDDWSKNGYHKMYIGEILNVWVK